MSLPFAPPVPALPGLPPSPGAPSVPGTGGGEEGIIDLSPLAVALAAAVLVVNGIVSLKFNLGMHTQLLVASVRMVVQLSVLGYILVPIFQYDRWWLVLLYGCFMLVIASLEAVQRPGYAFEGMLRNAVFAMAASSGAMLVYAVLVVLAVRPVWQAHYVIPLLGMILGNATSSISVGLTTVLEDLSTNRAVIEYLLALGANRFEATDAVVRRSLKVSMTPLINQMQLMGLVSIPGMMTGQILAGGDPAQAARYQMMIMFVVGGSTCLACVISVYLAVLHVVDSNHQFRADRLQRKQPGGGGVVAAALAAAPQAWAAARRKVAALGTCLAAACCCCLCPPPPPRRRRLYDSANGAAAAGAAVGEASSPLLPPAEPGAALEGDDSARRAFVAAWAEAAAGAAASWRANAGAVGARMVHLLRGRAGGDAAKRAGGDGTRPAAGAGHGPDMAGHGGGAAAEGAGTAAAAGNGGSQAQPVPLPVSHHAGHFSERLRSESVASSLLTLPDAAGGLTSPLSPRSVGAAAARDEEGAPGAGHAGRQGGGSGGRGEAAQQLLPSGSPRSSAHGGPSGRSGGVLGASVAAATAVGGWLSTRAVGAWDAVGRWRGVGSGSAGVGSGGGSGGGAPSSGGGIAERQPSGP